MPVCVGVAVLALCGCVCVGISTFSIVGVRARMSVNHITIFVSGDSLSARTTITVPVSMSVTTTSVRGGSRTFSPTTNGYAPFAGCCTIQLEQQSVPVSGIQCIIDFVHDWCRQCSLIHLIFDISRQTHIALHKVG